MSTGSNYANTSVASRPILTLGAQRNFNTWSSIDQELTPSRYAPPAVKARTGLRGAPGKIGHASFPSVRAFFEPSKLREAILDVLLIGGAVAVGLSAALSTIVFFAMVFLMKF